jgi:hypothetical protein
MWFGRAGHPGTEFQFWCGLMENNSDQNYDLLGW